jgi:hypothetical protein
MNLNRKIQINIRGKWLIVIASAALMLSIVFNCFYLFSDYNYLVDWYLKMNGCFYRHEHWKDSFFTPATKEHGNVLCVMALGIEVILLYYLIKRLKPPGGSLKVKFTKGEILMLLLCILTGTVVWIWGYSLVHQGFDEVFSAVNCASLPSFQTLSYYMLPNNHILFNVLNGILFHYAGDKVFSGKLISLVCYWAIIAIAFAWLSSIIKNKILLIAATILLLFQFPIWGFGFEARGYELYAAAEWSAFFTLLQYLRTKNSQWLYYYVLACSAGYLCIPVFLYFHASLILFGLFLTIYNRMADPKFWKAQLSVVLIAFLLYLPAICFSGAKALVGNPYVLGQIHGSREFYVKGITAFQGYLNFYTSNFTNGHNSIEWALFLLPLALFCFYKNKLAVLCGFFYLAMWLVCIVLAYGMKIFPINRTMTGHLNISLALTIYTLYLLLSKLNSALKVSFITDALLIMVLLFLVNQFRIGNTANINFGLYNNDINLKYDLLMRKGISFIPKGSSVAFSDECFYWYYQCKLRGDRVSQPMSGKEQYFVKLASDPMPLSYINRYVLVKTVFKLNITAQRYEIYRNKLQQPRPFCRKIGF